MIIYYPSSKENPVFLCLTICSKDLLIFKNILSELMNWPNIFEKENISQIRQKSQMWLINFCLGKGTAGGWLASPAHYWGEGMRLGVGRFRVQALVPTQVLFS